MTISLLTKIRQRLSTRARTADVLDSANTVKSLSASSKRASVPKSRPSYLQLCVALYHWIVCLTITGLVLSQLLGAVWDYKTTMEHILYGRSPLLGPYQIVGSNDIPFADRVIACVRHGEVYEPRVVSSLLATEGVEAILEDDTGTAVTGYRIVQRHAPLQTDALDSLARKVYRASCILIADTLESILDSCSALGYSNLTRDVLRVVDDWDSDQLFRLPNTLPVLIMPFSDNAFNARHAIPTWGGDACIFRLRDAYSSSASDATGQMARFSGVNQSVHHERTLEWLDRPGGIWKNGWYEDLKGMRWYSDVLSSARGPPFNMMHRVFDMRLGLEVDCSDQSVCEDSARVDRWGEKFHREGQSASDTSVMIANGTQFGFFIYEADMTYTVVSVFDWETLLSNTSVGLVLMRWAYALVALHIGALRGKIQWFGGGIGCISSAETFVLLPIAALPQLKMSLTAYWTVGCSFEGQQAGLSEAWFAIYPAITQLVLIYFSLLNLLAKVLRRRMSDVLFAPTVVVLCLLHYFRLELAASGWLSGIDGRVPTVVFSDEVQQLQLADYFTTDVAWRMNGRVKLLFAVKLGLLGVNLVPLLLARPFPIVKRGSDPGLEGMEKALALRIKHVGGLGQSNVYIRSESTEAKGRHISRALPMVTHIRDWITVSIRKQLKEQVEEKNGGMTLTITPVLKHNIQRGSTDSDGEASTRPTTHQSSPDHVVLLNGYELIRLGYLVFGDQYVITFEAWGILSSMILLRSYCHLWNQRVLVWTLRDEVSEEEAERMGGRAVLSTEPQMWRLDDPRLQSIRWWDISACGIQC